MLKHFYSWCYCFVVKDHEELVKILKNNKNNLDMITKNAKLFRKPYLNRVAGKF